MKQLLFFILIISDIGINAQNKTTLAEKPPLGWNSFDSYGVYLHEQAALENLEVFAEKLKPYGYEYFVIDAGWWGEYELIPGTMYPAEKHAHKVAIDSFGRVEPSQVYFPNGLKPIIDRAHQLNIKIGVHLMRGIPCKSVKLNTPVLGTKFHARDIVDTTSICVWNPQNYGIDMDRPGAQEYYNSIYKKLAEWGIDFVKVDDLIPYPKEIVAIGKAIRNSGRDMVYSLSPGGNANLKDLRYYKAAQMVRITHDIWDDTLSIDRSFEAWRIWQGIGYPGFWPDLDMIPFGNLQLMNPKETQHEGNDVLLAGKGHKRVSEFTKPQMRTFITQRAIAASPIIIGGDLPTLNGYSLELLTNKDMLECNQNSHPGTLIKETDGLEVWGACTNDIQLKGWIGFFNRSNQNKEVALNRFNLGLLNYYGNKAMEKTVKSKFKVKDIWGKEVLVLDRNDISMTIAPGDVLFISYEEIIE